MANKLRLVHVRVNFYHFLFTRVSGGERAGNNRRVSCFNTARSPFQPRAIIFRSLGKWLLLFVFLFIGGWRGGKSAFGGVLGLFFACWNLFRH